MTPSSTIQRACRRGVFLPHAPSRPTQSTHRVIRKPCLPTCANLCKRDDGVHTQCHDKSGSVRVRFARSSSMRADRLVAWCSRFKTWPLYAGWPPSCKYRFGRRRVLTGTQTCRHEHQVSWIDVDPAGRERHAAISRTVVGTPDSRIKKICGILNNLPSLQHAQ